MPLPNATDAPDQADPGFEGADSQSVARTALDPDGNPFAPSEAGAYDYTPPEVMPARRHGRPLVNLALLALTLITTTYVGMADYIAFMGDYRPVTVSGSLSHLLVLGFWYSATILVILGSHELGHYLTCRYYDVDASLPYFIPAPPPFVLTGTFGAFIKIRERVRSKRQLFDIGIAGPLAGFAFTVPALFLGISMSHVARVPPDFVGYDLGEPLLLKLATAITWGTIPEGYSLNMHPMAFAAWWGMLATALNLFPIGQLDGGHISYAVLGRRSTLVTKIMVGVTLVLTFFSLSWLFWTVLMLVMLKIFGVQHPATLDEHVPLDRTRIVLAILALIIFILCFTPSPIQPTDLLGK